MGELYCGAGGLACGALHAESNDHAFGIQHAWANDFDGNACATYRRNICPDNPDSVICKDVRQLDLDCLPEIDAFACGFPCNSFSSVGEHRGIANEKFGQLYWYGVEVLHKFQPKWFMAENVSGITSAGDNDFQTILHDMQNAGYQLTVHLYKAEDYGVPQKRHRIIIVGIRNVLDVAFHVPDPVQYAECDISSWTALQRIPSDASNNEIHMPSKRIAERLSYIKPGENLWMAETHMPEKYHIHTKTRISQIYRKLDPLKPSSTITAAGGGGTAGYHWDNRELTNRERARLQTFPDDFVFTGNYASVRRQIGMAVPCKLANVVATAVLNSFAGIEYPLIEPNYQVSE